MKTKTWWNWRDAGVMATCLLLGADVVLAEEFPKFTRQIIDPAIGKVCYAVTSADVNGDGHQDVVAVSENRVQWYEFPNWTKHVILENQTDLDNVCIAAGDIDGDGKVDFGLGAGWTKIGTIQWITRKEDPNATWSVHPIAVELSTHRMTFADVLGSGKPQLVVSPLNKSRGDGARLLAFSVPANPAKDRWPETALNTSFNRVHAHSHVDWDRESPIDTLTGSQEGIHVITKGAEGSFTATRIATGASGQAAEQQGTGEVKLGKWPNALDGSRAGSRFLAAIEPMHGNEVVFYQPMPEGQWKRNVLDTSLKQGHAVWTADLTGDGRDEIIVGSREFAKGVTNTGSAHLPDGTLPTSSGGLAVYKANDVVAMIYPPMYGFTKFVIDPEGCAVEDAFAFDLDEDGDLDIVAGGRSTQNVVIYWNERVGKKERASNTR